MLEVVPKEQIWHTLQEVKGPSARERIISAAFLKSKLFDKNLWQGAKNKPLTKTECLYIQNFEKMTRKKHCKYLQASLRAISVKCINTKNKNVAEF